MFHSKPVADPPTDHVDVEPLAELIALSHLQLDLPAPGEGWPVHLARRGVEITLDDLGRASIARADARRLFSERREAEARSREKAAERERQAVEADQRFRAQLGVGVPASAFAGMTYAEAVAAAELDSQVYRPRASVVEDLLSNDGGLTFHPISPAAPVEE
jgi:hypothetical protein